MHKLKTQLTDKVRLVASLLDDKDRLSREIFELRQSAVQRDARNESLQNRLHDCERRLELATRLSVSDQKVNIEAQFAQDAVHQNFEAICFKVYEENRQLKHNLAEVQARHDTLQQALSQEWRQSAKSVVTVKDIEAGQCEDVEMSEDSGPQAPNREALEGILASLLDLKNSFAAHIQEVSGLKASVQQLSKIKAAHEAEIKQLSEKLASVVAKPAVAAGGRKVMIAKDTVPQQGEEPSAERQEVARLQQANKVLQMEVERCKKLLQLNPAEQLDANQAKMQVFQKFMRTITMAQRLVEQIPPQPPQQQEQP